MKILVVSTWFPYPPDNGSKLRAWHLLRQLASRHRVTLATFCDGGHPDADRLAPLESLCEQVLVIPRGAFHAGPLGLRGLASPVPRAYVQAFAPDMQRHIAAAMPGHDAVVACEITSALHVARLDTPPAIFEDAEVAVIRDRFVSERSPLRRLRRGLTWTKHARFVRRLCARFERTTVVSDAERRLLERIGCDPDRLAVVPNGVDEADLAWRGVHAPCRLIYAGSMTYAANEEAVRWLLAEILPRVRRARPEVDCWVTGSTSGVDVQALPNASQVTFTGHLPDVRPAIADATVSVVPLRSGGGTRLKILQAMALGTPVVATAKGAEGLTVVPEQHLLIGNTAEQFAAQVVRLLSDDSLRERMSAEARQLVGKRYTWTQSGALLDQVIQEAIATRKGEHA